jgi:hypothetical protein
VGYKAEDLGEVLEGDRMVGTPYDVSFRVDRDNESLCKKVGLARWCSPPKLTLVHFSAQRRHFLWGTLSESSDNHG